MTVPSSRIEIAVADERWRGAVADLEAFAERAVRAGLTAVPESRDRSVEVSVMLADDAAVQVLNRTWRDRDRPTNVLSFPAARSPIPPGEPEPLGDLVLAYDTLLRESEEQSAPLEHHLAHLLVHGTLHLLGQDHETGEAQAEAMEALEIAALAELGIPNPYAD